MSEDIEFLARLAGIPPAGIHEQVNERLRECAVMLDYTYPLPVVVFDLKGHTAGLAYYKQNRIRLNVELLHTDTEEMLNNTLPHEFAHIVAYRRYGAEGVGHGKYWQYVMFQLGLVPNRTHKMRTTPARQRQQFKYECDCGTLMVGSTRHNRIVAGEANYQCKYCKQRLRRVDGD